VLCLLLAVRRWDPFDAVLCLLLAARWEAQQGHHARCCSWLSAIVGVFRRVHRVRRACQVPLPQMNLSCAMRPPALWPVRQTDFMLIVTLVLKSVTALYRRYRAVAL